MFHVLQLPMKWWNIFFHTRTSSTTTSVFVLCGRLRIFYAILVLFDRYILSYDFHFFFLSGIIPCDQHYIYSSINSSSLKPTSFMCSIVGVLSPQYSHYVYYTFFYFSIINAVLLLLGILPKLQLLLLHVNMLSFHHHSSLIWDGEDNMFRLWNFLFLFVPLHHVTIYDNFRHLFYYTSNTVANSTTTRSEDVDTWPMWPFRLWQIEIWCIYIGAGYAKLATEIWSSGNALYSIIHTKDFFGGPIVPDFIFNRRGPLHVLTWASLVVECGSIIFIWPKCTRHFTLISIILLHVGIDGAMNMHCFEWLSILGWLFFLVERQQSDVGSISASNETTTTKHVKSTSTSTTLTQTNTLKDSRWSRIFINFFIFIVTASFLFDTIPFVQFAGMLPNMGDTTDVLEHLLLTLDDFRTDVAQPKYYEPYLFPLGLHQGTWDLFTGTNDHNYRFETIVTFENGTSIEHWSPDWGTMTWYEKKRWQRPMTFYENFAEHGCKDCYAIYYAQQYGPEVASVRINSHCEYPELEPPGNLFDMEYFFRSAKETLVRSPPEELFVLNYCDDTLDECEEYANRGRCRSRNDETLSGMVVHCRYSCQMCHNEANTLQVGARIAVYFAVHRQYVDGTVLDAKVIQHIRHFLIEYDRFHATPKWTTSMSLRNRGLLILTYDDAEMNAEKGDDHSFRDGDEDLLDESEDGIEIDEIGVSPNANVDKDESYDDEEEDEADDLHEEDESDEGEFLEHDEL